MLKKKGMYKNLNKWYNLSNNNICLQLKKLEKIHPIKIYQNRSIIMKILFKFQIMMRNLEVQINLMNYQMMLRKTR